MPTHYLPFFPFSMLSSPAVLIHWPSQELSYPSGQAQLQLGGDGVGGGVKERKKWVRGLDCERQMRVSDVSWDAAKGEFPLMAEDSSATLIGY